MPIAYSALVMLNASTLAAAVSFLLLLGKPSSAESQRRFVAGVVTDARGNELPGAVVQLENQVTLSVRSYNTGHDGRYHFNGIDTDMDYALKARYRTHWSKPHLLTRFDSTRQDIPLVIPID